MIKKLLYLLYIGVLVPVTAFAQINTDRVMTIGKNALYFEDYVLSIQYFNQVINAKPYLADPYFYRGLAKMNLDDYPGAERDCSEALERNPFVVNAYQVRGISRIRQKNYKGAIEDYQRALKLDPENISLWHNLVLCRMQEKRLYDSPGRTGYDYPYLSALYGCLSDARGEFAEVERYAASHERCGPGHRNGPLQSRYMVFKRYAVYDALQI